MPNVHNGGTRFSVGTTVALDPAPACRVVRLQAALAEQLFDIRNESEYRRCQRTAQRISSGSVCRHLKIAGRLAFFMISSDYQPPAAKVATQPTDVTTSGTRCPESTSNL